ncbi:MAG: flgL, partial [Anaerocolumna sp.]|nr:flgL [Anaerocolumna sp.]
GVGTALDAPIDTTSTIDSTKTSQLISVFNQLIKDLGDNDTTGISKGLARIDAHFSNINAVRSEIGVKTNRLELTLNRIGGDTLNLKDLLSKNEDADMSEVIMNLKMQESVYQASLSGGARIIQPTLLDFLR